MLGERQLVASTAHGMEGTVNMPPLPEHRMGKTQLALIEHLLSASPKAHCMLLTQSYGRCTFKGTDHSFSKPLGAPPSPSLKPLST